MFLRTSAVGLLLAGVGLTQPPDRFGGPPGGPGGFGPPGGFGGPPGMVATRKLVKEFDADGNGRLDAAERK